MTYNIILVVSTVAIYTEGATYIHVQAVIEYIHHTCTQLTKQYMYSIYIVCVCVPKCSVYMWHHAFLALPCVYHNYTYIYRNALFGSDHSSKELLMGNVFVYMYTYT